MDNKQECYDKLVKKIHDCNCCNAIKKPMFCKDGVCLINVPEKYKNKMKHVNMWNYWQGSLDAKIMVIGQDYGSFPKIESEDKDGKKKNTEYYFEECIYRDAFTKIKTKGDIENEYKQLRKIWSITDANLFYLFKKVLGYDLTKENEDLFFTNMACCYRNKGDATSGSENYRSEWLSLCANKYMRELIDIIQPQVIITLGENTFNALSCIDGMELKCIKPIELNDMKEKLSEDNRKLKFSDVIYYEYELEYSKDKAIHVFPVYHPGPNSNMNRPLQETGTNEEGQSQESDWGKIRDFLRKIAKKR